jgi:hypothetical protein
MSSYEAQPISAITAPLEIEAVGDEVVFIGPGAVAFAMTWAAAHQTAERLREVMAAAEEAGTARDDLSKI